MDEPPPRRMSLHYGLLTAAVALSLLPGCAWLRGARNAKRDATPAHGSDSSKATQIAGDRAPAAVVGLDGSAADDGSLKMPNAPAIAATAPQAGADAAEQLAAAAPEANKTKKSNAGTTGAADNAQEVEHPDELVGASASEGGGRAATADLRTETRTAPSTTPGETLTNLPGSFDVIGDGVRVEQGVVAATVNGHPIFVEDVTRDLPIDFAKAERDMPPEQFREWRRQIIEMHLQRPIEEELLLQALKIKLKPEQIKQIAQQIDAMFNKEILPSVMKQQGFDTEAEFERALRAKGSSVEMLRTKNRNREFAQQYIGATVKPKEGFDLPDLRKYYKDHKEDYAIVAQAKWEQIHLKYS
ncbi:MAG TPA: SurA N-terminal domain-containing protein, partial [Planctomycetaceae bacterium]